MQTVLLVENDPAKLVARSLILHCFGYKVLEAGSRGEAWRVCHGHRGPIHVVLTNAIPGNASSSQFVARLQLLYPQILALFLSDASSAELADRQNMPEYAHSATPWASVHLLLAAAFTTMSKAFAISSRVLMGGSFSFGAGGLARISWLRNSRNLIRIRMCPR